MNNRKGGLNDFKLVHEALQSEPVYQPETKQKGVRTAKNRSVGYYIRNRLANYIPAILQQLKASDKLIILLNIVKRG